LQLIESTLAKSVSLNEKVSEISRKLKLLARELKIPVIVLSQLNRGVEGRSNKMPMLSDLRDSGAIEQDADIVLLMCRPDYYDKTERPGEVDFEIAKNRGGPTGKCVLLWEKAFLRFRDRMEESPFESNPNPYAAVSAPGDGF
jgi:replicative DNA helicase